MHELDHGARGGEHYPYHGIDIQEGSASSAAREFSLKVPLLANNMEGVKVEMGGLDKIFIELILALKSNGQWIWILDVVKG